MKASKLKDESKKFEEILLSILLINNDTGELVKAINDWRFNVSLQVYTLPKGSYTIVVDPIWNDCAKNHPEY